MFRKAALTLVVLLVLAGFCPNLSVAEKPDRGAAPDKALSLSDLYRLAMKRSEAIRISEEDLYVAKKMKEKAFSVLAPRFSAFGGATGFSERKMVLGSVIQPDWAASWGVALGQSFTLNGKELIAFRMADKNIKKFQYDLYAVTEAYIFQVAIHYYAVIKASEARQIAEANVNRLKKHRDAVLVRLGLGDVAKTALYRAEAELSKSKTDLIGARNAEKLARVTLATALAIPEGFEIQPPEFDSQRFHYNDPDALKQEALKGRAEMKAIEIDETISTDQVDLARSDYWPTLSVEGRYSRYDQDPSALVFNDESLSIGLHLDFLIYDGGLRRADIKETLSRLRQVQLARRALEKQISIEVERAYLDFITQKSVLDSSADQLRYASENYDAVSQQFQHGLANSVDVMDANTLLVTSERQLSDARYSHQLSALGVERAKGSFLKAIMEDL